MPKYDKLNHDTQFPYIGGVQVYAYENAFNYNRWSKGGVILTLTNVAWGGQHHPYFKNADERNNYFENRASAVEVQTTTFQNQAPLNEININVPFDVAQNYNYLWIYFPQKTPDGMGIEHENVNRLERMFYFVKDMQQLAPSTTKLSLELDFWTTYYDKIEYTSMNFERGHYPVVKSATPEQFLKNPVKNRQYLVTPDFNFGEIDTISHQEFYAQGGTSQKKIVFVLNCTSYTLKNMIGAVQDSNTQPVYNSDNTLNYTGSFSWRGMNYHQASPVNPVTLHQNDNTPDGTTAFYIDPDKLSTFATNIKNSFAQFFEYVLAVLVLPLELMTKSNDSFTFAGVNCTRVYSNSAAVAHLQDVLLEKTDFGLNTEFTKAYTYPYSAIEAVAPDGRQFLIKPQDIGEKLTINTHASLIYPWLNVQTLIEGVLSNSGTSYKWARLDGSIGDKYTFAGDFSKFLTQYQIPTYTIFYDAQSAYKLRSSANTSINRRNAIQAHNATVRNANLSYQTTSNNCSLATANTQVANNTAFAATSIQNQTGFDKTYQSLVYANTLRDNNNILSRNLNKLTNDCIADTAEATNDALASSTQITNRNELIHSAASVAGTILGSAAGGPVGLASGAIGAAGTLVGAAVNISTNNASLGISTAKNGGVALAQMGLNDGSTAQATQKNDADYNINREYSYISINLNNSMNSSLTSNQNSGNSQQTANSNSTNLTNSRNAQNNTINLSKQALLNAQSNNLDALNAAAHAPVITAGQSAYAGDAMPELLENRGWLFTTKTQNNDSIKAIVDYWKKYGYSWNGTISPGKLSDLALRDTFTFWKASGDVWVKGNAPEQVKQWFSYALEAGFTVWKNPDDAVSNKI